MTGQTKARIAAVTGSLLAAALLLHLTGFEGYKSYLLILATVIAGYPIVIKAVQSLRMKAFSIELLVSIAIIGALFIGEYVESAVVSFLFLFGAYLEARTLEKTRSSLKSLIDMAPMEATVLRNGEKVTIPVDEVKEGDRVFIQSGEKVAVDGRVVDFGRYRKTDRCLSCGACHRPRFLLHHPAHAKKRHCLLFGHDTGNREPEAGRVPGKRLD